MIQDTKDFSGSDAMVAGERKKMKCGNTNTREELLGSLGKEVKGSADNQ